MKTTRTRKTGRMKMKTKTKALAICAALACACGCDYVQRVEFAKERTDSLYRSAMEDYQAGRLPQAIAGLKKVCRKDPANSSARFQLACLLQDSEKDFFGAAHAFAEYIAQQPESDKAALAADRLATCERELALKLADKYGLNKVDGSRKLLEDARAERAKAEGRGKKLASDLESAMRRISALLDENERLKSSMAAVTADETSAPDNSEIKTAKALLEEDEDANAKPIIAQPADAKARRDIARQADRAIAEEQARKAAEREKRPDRYVVKEGDTLYKIAMRFYGRSSAWSMIRDANKATISMDGRVRSGQEIVLPDDPQGR